MRPGKLHPFSGLSFKSSLDKLRTPGDHFKSLIERLAPYAGNIARVADLATTHSTRIWIVEHTERDMTDAWLDPDAVAVAVTMRAELIVSNYFYLDE